MKLAKACTECRIGKRKCIATDTSGPCTGCLHRSLTCSLTLAAPQSIRDTRWRELHPQPSNTCTQDDELSLNDVVQLIDIYMALIHDKPHTLFHYPSLIKNMRQGKVPDKILYCLLAIASRFSPDPPMQRKSPEFAQRASDCVKRDVDVIDLESVQACILMGNICGADGHHDLESLYFGIAFRMAQIMRLPTPKASDDDLTREVKLRVWWSLYMIDCWSSAGNGVPRQLQNSHQNVLPMDELEFKSMRPGETSLSATRPGLWGHMVRLASIFSGIQDLHQQHANHDITEEQAEATTRHLASELDQFAEWLPPELKMTEQNVEWHARRGVGAAFVALHLGYYHYSTLLYFHYLDLQLDQSPSIIFFASRCRQHAAAFSDLLELTQRIPNCEAVYLIVAHMTVVSSAALLHTLLFGQESELNRTRTRLKHNFERLVELRRSWPAVSNLMERLFIFQRACMSSADPNTHKIDRWMVRFLLQHAVPVEEKNQNVASDAVRQEYADDAMAVLRGTV